MTLRSLRALRLNAILLFYKTVVRTFPTAITKTWLHGKLLCGLYCFTLFVSALPAYSQNFPVQASVQLVPPYTPYLGDYAAAGVDKMQVQLLLKDLTTFDYRVKLRFKIEGVGITIATTPGFSGPPLLLQGGAPLLLTSFELQPYLNPANLEFAGLSKADFVRTGRLPEGLYRFSLEVLDFNREKVVSNTALATAWIVLNDPPLLNLPFQNTKVTLTQPQYVTFQWTPRHTASPNAAFSTEYVFKLVEIWPADRDPNDALLSQRPLYETVTDFTQLVYGPAEPQLLPGRTYAWQVTARDIENRDLFKNQG
ncbi:MAG: hypothetical protein K2U26_20595, partial [Cyclobacteriaceae bacterium]|nr:hypothetical protein [Cyclobacteriaceae bacterium]